MWPKQPFPDSLRYINNGCFPKLWHSDLMVMPANGWAVVKNANQVEIAKLLVISIVWKEAFNLKLIFSHILYDHPTQAYIVHRKDGCFKVCFTKAQNITRPLLGILYRIQDPGHTFHLYLLYQLLSLLLPWNNSDLGPEEK